MKNCLLVMHPREISQCMNAFEKLRIAQVWLRGFTEKQIEAPINHFIADSDYDNYILASDDLVPSQFALEQVEKGLEKYEVFSGWSNMSPENSRANVRLKPIMGSGSAFALSQKSIPLKILIDRLKSYTFPTEKEILKQADSFRIYFAGFSFTGMRRELWLKFPFRAGIRGGADLVLSQSLRENRVSMYCGRNAFFYHLASKENVIVGKVRPSVTVR